MTVFKYQALTKQGTAVKGEVEASNHSAAVALIREKQLRPLVVTQSRSNQKATGGLLGAGRVKSDQLVIFTRELSAMVGAGVPLLRCLTSLGEHAENPALRRILEEVTADVQGGAPLADALEKHPKVFNSVYTNMVRAGEAAGILDDILKRLALQQEKNATIRKKIKSAMMYPMVLIGVTVIAFFGLMIFIIPQIGKIIKDLGGSDAELPALTQIMLAISSFITSWWFILLPAIGFGVFSLLRYLNTHAGKILLHKVALKLPGIKTIVTKVAVARFARTFSALIGAGVAVLEALEVTAHSVGNSVYEQALLATKERVRNGASLSSIIAQNELFPSIVSQMLSVGEETGQTDQVLVKVAEFYEEEVDVAIDGLSSIIEPVMIVLMGSMVGLIAASVMLPIANLSQSIK
jgi:type IV pilus assembly protein PilC